MTKIIETKENSDFNVKVTITVEWEPREDTFRTRDRADAALYVLASAASEMNSTLRGIRADV